MGNMKSIIILTLIALGSLLSAQENTYYYGVNGKIVEEQDKPIYQRKVWKTMGGYKMKLYVSAPEGWKWLRTEKTGVKKDGKLNIRYRHETFFPRVYKRYVEEIGMNRYYFRDEKGKDTLRMGTASSLVPLHLESMVTEFYKGGQLKSKSLYKNNELQSNDNWNKDGSEYISNVFYSTHKMPVYLNGQNALWEFILQTMKEKEFPLHEVEDEIIVGGVVMENGQLEGIRILKGRVESVNAFFTEAFKELPGRWQPAELHGEVVRCFITIPINLINDAPVLQTFELAGPQIFWSE